MGCNDCDGTKPISSDAVVHQCFSSCNSKADRAQYMENCQNACESGRKDSEVNDAADLSKKCDDKWEDLESSNKLEELCNDCDGTKPISSDAVVHQCFSSWNSKADRAQYMENCQNACESGRKDSIVNDAADLSKKCDDKWEDLKSSNKLEELCNDCD